jgi:hypothetical protein
MNALKARHAILTAAIVALWLPAAAAAGPVPAGNPAATQYTEAYPTAGGPKSTEGPHRGTPIPPAKVLGKDNARSLESQGQDGREAAALAAETAPSPSAGGTGGSTRHSRGAGGDAKSNGRNSGAEAQGGGGGGGSGLGEVLGQASGASASGGFAPFLPLAIVAAVVWSLAYLVRQRRNQTE